MFLDALRTDFRYTLASARGNKGFFAAAVLTFALGIGATTATFSAAYGVLLRPLPYPQSHEIVQIFEEHPGAPAQPGYPPISNTTFYAWRQNIRSLDSVGMYGQRDFTVSFPGDSARVHGGEVSPAIFNILRVNPQLGRFFVSSDDVAGHHDFVVLSDRLWRDRFGASTAVIGQTITVDARPHQIVGVAPAGFAFPDNNSLMWTPFDDPTILTPAVQGGMWLGQALGRLKPGATIADIETEGTRAARSVTRPAVADLLFGKGDTVRVRARTLIEQTTMSARPALMVLAAGVVLVLFVGCANVANLLFARGIAREREFVLRAGIGASRARLVQQMLTESAVLAVCGGLLGMAIGAAFLRLASTLAAPTFPRFDAVHFDGVAAIFAAALATISALLAGTAPALRLSRVDLAGALRGGADGASATGFRGRRARITRDVLLAAETAFAVLLLIGAGLLGRSFVQLLRVDPGYTPTGVLSARLHLPADATPARAAQFVTNVLDRLRADGRVVSAGAGNMMPFSESTTVAAFNLQGTGAGGKPERAQATYYIVTPGYAEALGLRVKAGRLFGANEGAAGTPPIILNEEFARRYLSKGSVIGAQLPPSRAGAKAREIVGVVAPQLKDGNDTSVTPEVYVPVSDTLQFGDDIAIVLRTTGEPMELAASVRAAALAADASAVISETATLEHRVADSVRRPRFAAAVLIAFAVLAVTLAGIGIYGVLSYSVTQRARELAVRAALGARRGSLIALVLRHGLIVTGVGAVVGVFCAAVMTRLMASMLFGVGALDPLAFAAAPLIVLPTAILACIIPAMNASRADPSATLRQ